MKSIDRHFLTDSVRIIAGTDEAGRGPLAGPVVAAAVILPPGFHDARINDSKKLSEPLREELFELIKRESVTYAYTVLSHRTIDEINILKASLLAMKRSVSKLKIKPDVILVDGNKTFKYDSEVIPVIRGDSKSLSIASASIVAKVVRDRIMKKLARKYPVYGWEMNKGYPTPSHIAAILKYGPSELHRKTFLVRIFEKNSQRTLKAIPESEND